MVDVKERFFNNVIKTSRCWLWVGAKQSDGYGMFSPSGRRSSTSAHRYSYFLHFGEIKQGANVLHRCDNPSCINPNHLFLGTRSDNMQDMKKKGRGNYISGSKSHLAKLTEEDVINIRSNYSSERHSEIARMYGVHRTTISNILNYRTWA